MSASTLPGHVPLVVATRGGTVENVHHGSLVAVDHDGRTLLSFGDPDAVVFTRSTLKPFQALPFLLDGGDRRYGLGAREVALLASSHSGEPRHVAAVDAVLAACGLGAGDLRCGCHEPYVYEALGLVAPPRGGYDARHHNCSGKHAGFLAYCRLHDLPTATYLEAGHPLQLRIKTTLAGLLGVDEGTLPSGVDGCGAPNHALPLASAARLWARFVAGSGDRATDDALARLSAAMIAHPEYVSGIGRSDLVLARAGKGDWIAKAGAAGVQVLASRSRRLGIAIKIADGNADARLVALLAALRVLGMAPGSDAELDHLARPPLRNASGTVIGDLRPAGALAQAAAGC